jgi:hypothetical protein
MRRLYCLVESTCGQVDVVAAPLIVCDDDARRLPALVQLSIISVLASILLLNHLLLICALSIY